MNLYEVIGIIIGDGNILYNLKNRTYRLEITGNAEEDNDYFNKILNTLKTECKNKVRIRIKLEKNGKGLRLHVNDKSFVERLHAKFGLPFGKKTFTISIKKELMNWKFSKHIIRGICESDGCIYFSKSKCSKYPTYPRIEIRTSSKRLAKQLMNILSKKDFRVNYLKCKKTAKIYVSGSEMLNKWIKEIGFNNCKNLSKIQLWKTLGYYIPKTTHIQRLKILKDNI